MIDFRELKQRCSIGDVARGFLSLNISEDGKEIRAECPHCKSGDPRAIIITPSKGLFYCFTARKGGDLISLVSHCHGTNVRESAEALAKVYMDADAVALSDNKETSEEETCNGFNPLTYLDTDHPLVKELGFEPIATKAGIGYAPKGLMRTHVAIPVRLEDGTLVGYLGIKGNVKVPKNWRVA